MVYIEDHKLLLDADDIILLIQKYFFSISLVAIGLSTECLSLYFKHGNQ